MGPVEIRQLCANDVREHSDEIKQYLEYVFNAGQPASDTRELQKKKLLSLVRNLQESSAYALGAFNDGALAGFLWAYEIEQPESCRALHIAYISVAENSRRQGIGKALLEAAMKIARELNCSSVELCVDSRNHEARELYESYSFKIEKLLMRAAID